MTQIRHIKGGAEGIKGCLSFAGDKSCAHRVLLMAAIARGESRIANLPASADILSTIHCLRALGVAINIKHGTACVRGVGLRGFRAPAGPLDCGNSGTTMRLLCGILAGQSFRATLTGDASLLRRPMDRVAVPLGLMGADFHVRNGKPPLSVKGGQLSPLTYIMPVHSAQVKSAILLAGLNAAGVTTVMESVPTRDHTENMLPLFGAAVFKRGGQCSVLGGQVLRGAELTLPGDISSAAFFIAAAAAVPGSRFEARGVLINPLRTGFLNALKRMGADITVRAKTVLAGESAGDIEVRGGKLSGCAFGGADIPSMVDEIPALAVAAAFSEGLTVISGAGELRKKESDRLKAVVSFLTALGVRAAEFPDGLAIEGAGRLSAGRIFSGGDHRVCMAAAVAASLARGTSDIYGPDCVSVSYPAFFSDLARVCHA